MAQWSGDGTQDPGPPPLHGDPLSGLVTGGRQEQEAFRVRVVEPSLPDISAVREAMAAVLDDDESELMLAPPPADNGPATSELPKVSDPAGTVDSGGPAAAKPPAAPPAASPPPPARAPRKASAVSIPAQRTAEPAAAAEPPRRGISPGIAAIVALLVVIAVLAIIAVASLIDTIASLFS